MGERAGTVSPKQKARGRDLGFTLIEMLIALGLFALIALAGFGLIEAILGAQTRTQGRLDRLADIQRAMVLVSRDFEQMADAPLLAAPTAVTLARHGPDGEVLVRYALRDGTLERTIGTPTRSHAQRLVDHVAGLRWQYFLASAGWLPGWPPAGVAPTVRPSAIALDLDLAPEAGFPGGSVRRLVALPARP